MAKAKETESAPKRRTKAAVVGEAEETKAPEEKTRKTAKLPASDTSGRTRRTRAPLDSTSETAQSEPQPEVKTRTRRTRVAESLLLPLPEAEPPSEKEPAPPPAAVVPDVIVTPPVSSPPPSSDSPSDLSSASPAESEITTSTGPSNDTTNDTTPPREVITVETPPAPEVYTPPKPKHSYGYLASLTLGDLRKIGKELGVTGETLLRKDDLIISVLKAQAESMNYKFGGGTLEILPEGFGFLRPKGMLPTDSDVYLSVSQIRRFGLRNGDVIWGLIRPPREQEHYEALLRVETVNFSDPEHSRRRAQFGQLTPIFPNTRMNLETWPKELATRLVDMFAPIGMGQRALIVSPPKAGKTTLLKRIAGAISFNCPDVILMALLIDERPEEVTDISRSVEGEVIASTFDRPADEHIRVANLALEKAKRLAEAKRDVVILLDSITRLARASNLTVPPSGRTLSGGLDPSGLYFPKRFFGAARNFEEGGSLTIIGTALTDTGSRMDDVIYEEFKGTGNMELHLSRKLAEQRIFPAIDITRSGTRREELLIADDELARLWVLRKRIVGVDEAGALNLILDKLRQTQTNRDFLMSIKLP